MIPPVQIKLPTKTKEMALNGSCRYNLDGDTIQINIDEIANNRIETTVSGELALELWALPTPYQGGQFAGQPMAGAHLGTLRGQHCFRNWEFSQPVVRPSEGTWYLTLMLREWQNGGYITLDYMNFPDPVHADYQLMLKFA